MSDQPGLDAVRAAFREERFRITGHAQIEAMLERISEANIVRAGAGAEVLEDYLDRPEGHTQLLLGYARPDEPIHIVVNIDAFERDIADHLIIVTVYRPERPAWLDERTRRRHR